MQLLTSKSNYLVMCSRDFEKELLVLSKLYNNTIKLLQNQKNKKKKKKSLKPEMLYIYLQK